MNLKKCQKGVGKRNGMICFGQGVWGWKRYLCQKRKGDLKIRGVALGLGGVNDSVG